MDIVYQFGHAFIFSFFLLECSINGKVNNCFSKAKVLLELMSDPELMHHKIFKDNIR